MKEMISILTIKTMIAAFVGNGIPADHAAKMVHAAVDKGYSERDLEAMERYMANERGKNRPMDEVVSGMNSLMERGEMNDMQMQDRMGGGSMHGPNSGGMGGMSGMGGRR